jgi:hypothetical protein
VPIGGVVDFSRECMVRQRRLSWVVVFSSSDVTLMPSFDWMIPYFEMLEGKWKVRKQDDDELMKSLLTRVVGNTGGAIVFKKIRGTATTSF